MCASLLLRLPVLQHQCALSVGCSFVLSNIFLWRLRADSICLAPPIITSFTRDLQAKQCITENHSKEKMLSSSFLLFDVSNASVTISSIFVFSSMANENRSEFFSFNIQRDDSGNSVGIVPLGLGPEVSSRFGTAAMEISLRIQRTPHLSYTPESPGIHPENQTSWSSR